MPHALTPNLAEHFARIALGHVGREYPFVLFGHVLNDSEDVKRPRELWPIFHGSFDWHSCVHGYWLLLTLLRRFPDLPAAGEIAALADRMLTEDKVSGERAYLDREYSGTFERPYGWAWLLALHIETARHEERDWAKNLEPLARALADRFALYVPKLSYPVRVGTHYNTAFALVLAHKWAERFDPALATLITERARFLYGEDRACQAWEPGGDDFLSSALIEALCMKTVLDAAEFRTWFAAFLPDFSRGEPASLFRPATPSDRSDGKIAHLDGYNLSKAWCWRAIAPALDAGLADQARAIAETHLDTSMPHVAGEYMGEHWLASFAALALLA